MVRDSVICFQHCCSSKKIFCKIVPDSCPNCHSYIVNYTVEPFVVPYPYTNAAHQPNEIVVRPSQGSWLNDYDVLSDLHIGLVNSKGVVFEFDNSGLIINDHLKWTDVLAIKIIPSSWNDHWDETLESIIQDDRWKSYNYNEDTMNCFSFVLQFVNNLKYMDLMFINKEDMCEQLLMPRIKDVVKYNLLFRNLKDSDYFVSN